MKELTTPQGYCNALERGQRGGIGDLNTNGKGFCGNYPSLAALVQRQRHITVGRGRKRCTYIRPTAANYAYVSLLCLVWLLWPTKPTVLVCVTKGLCKNKRLLMATVCETRRAALRKIHPTGVDPHPFKKLNFPSKPRTGEKKTSSPAGKDR